MRSTSPLSLALATIAILGLIFFMAWANGPSYFQTLLSGALR